MSEDMEVNNKATQQQIDAMVIARREALQETGDAKDKWGLALSGGGIRSATFCFGLLRALSEKKLLKKFDLLSTVSGGGYIGATLGAFINGTENKNDPVLDKFGNPNIENQKKLIEHLRSNGRYLISGGPGGKIDSALLYLRNIVAIQAAIALIASFLGMMLALVNMLTWWGIDKWIIASAASDEVFSWQRHLYPWLPTLWPIGVLLLFASPLLASLSGNSHRPLACTLKYGLLIIGFGIIDRVAWALAFESSSLQYGLGLAAVVLIGIGQVLFQRLPKTKIQPETIMFAGNIFGRALFLIITIFWVSIIYKVAITPVFFEGETLNYNYFFTHFPVLIAGISLAYLALALLMGDTNKYGLHYFYTNKLRNAYLNIASAIPGGTEKADKLDPTLSNYKPHCYGGPVHLINCCINQTVPNRNGAINIDRQSHLLTVGPQGLWMLEQKTKTDTPLPLKLSDWAAISGAAAAPGMGALTNGGISCFLSMLSIRIGFWLKNPYSNKSSYLLGLLINEFLGRYPGTESPYWYLSDGGHFENTGAYALVAHHCKYIVVADCGADAEYAFNDLENLIRKIRIDFNVETEFFRPAQNTKGTSKSRTHIGQFANSLGIDVSYFGTLDDISSKNSQACLALAKLIYPDNDPGWMLIVKPNLVPDLPVDLANYAFNHPNFPQETTADQFFDEAQWESYFRLGYHLGSKIDHNLKNLADSSENFEQYFVEEKTGPSPNTPPSRQPLRFSNIAVTTTLSAGALFTGATAAWKFVDEEFQKRSDERNREIVTVSDITNYWTTLPVSDKANNKPVYDKRQLEALNNLANSFIHFNEILCPKKNSAKIWDSERFQIIFGETFERCSQIESEFASTPCKLLLTKYVSRKLQGDTTLEKSINQNGDSDFATCFSATINYYGHYNPTYWGYSYSNYRESFGSLHPKDVAAFKVFQETEALREFYINSMSSNSAPSKPKESSSSRKEVETSSADNANANLCRGMTIYIQIYGSQMRDIVRQYREPWRQLGASVPPIEDVNATAISKGRNLPTPYNKTTVIFHDEGSKACAIKLSSQAGKSSWDVVPLNSKLRPTKGVIEVWISPSKNESDSRNNKNGTTVKTPASNKS